MTEKKKETRGRPRSVPSRLPPMTIPPDLVIGDQFDFLPLAGEVNWGIATFGVDKLRSITDGKGQKIGVVDTGIDADHPLVVANVLAAKDFTGSSNGSKDRNGHGTHCSGTAAGSDPRIGVAHGAKILHGKGLGNSGSGSSRALIGAMEWCVSQGCEVLSCSWGSSGEDPNITAALKEYAAAGVWPIFAAGNSGAGTPDVDWPGRSEWCIDVAALAPNLSPASFTSAGAKIDTAGPGVDIISARAGGGYVSMSGTSMATPFVAGLLTLFRAALKLKAKPIPTVAELRQLLFSRSTDAHTPGDDRRTGPGWATPLLLALQLVDDPPPVAYAPTPAPAEVIVIDAEFTATPGADDASRGDDAGPPADPNGPDLGGES